MISLTDKNNSFEKFLTKDKNIAIKNLEIVLAESRKYKTIPPKWSQSIGSDVYSRFDNSIIELSIDQIKYLLGNKNDDKSFLLKNVFLETFFKCSIQEQESFYKTLFYNYLIYCGGSRVHFNTRMTSFIKILKSDTLKIQNFKINKTYFGNNKEFILSDPGFNWKKYESYVSIPYETSPYNLNMKFQVEILQNQCSITKPLVIDGIFQRLKKSELETIFNIKRVMNTIARDQQYIKNIPLIIQNYLLLK